MVIITLVTFSVVIITFFCSTLMFDPVPKLRHIHIYLSIRTMVASLINIFNLNSEYKRFSHIERSNSFMSKILPGGVGGSLGRSTSQISRFVSTFNISFFIYIFLETIVNYTHYETKLQNTLFPIGSIHFCHSTSWRGVIFLLKDFLFRRDIYVNYWPLGENSIYRDL